MERRKRYQDTVAKIKDGTIATIQDFITYNLDICAFAQDVIDTVDDPQFIRVVYTIIKNMTILDPTCGSGAFLFAALNILEPLYSSCLSRMEDYLKSGISLNKFVRRMFEDELELIDNHLNKQYYIYKTIILNNLYGVDIMKEATETAKLRLFLKLVSTANPNYGKANIGIEPLPDIDFNIKCGNSLVGYATKQEVDKGLLGNLYSYLMGGQVKESLLQLSMVTHRYKQYQLQGDDDYENFKAEKAKLKSRQQAVNEILDKTLYEEMSEKREYSDWLKKTQPFHWISEFYDIISDEDGNGGFDVVIGNPPYVDISSKIPYSLMHYDTLKGGNLYGYCVERAMGLINGNGQISMIVPMSIVKMPTYKKLRVLLQSKICYYSVYSADSHPGTLFNGVQQNLAIFVRSSISGNKTYTTKFKRFYSEERPALFDNIVYAEMHYDNIVGNRMEELIFTKLYRHKPISSYLSDRKTDYSICMKNTSGSQFKLFYEDEPFYSINGVQVQSTTIKYLYFYDDEMVKIALGLYNSNLFNLWWCSLSDGRHITAREYATFPIAILTDLQKEKLFRAFENLQSDLQLHAKRVTYKKANGITVYDQFDPKASIDKINQLDLVLKDAYGFTPEEIDYIISYDYKYRMHNENLDE